MFKSTIPINPELARRLLAGLGLVLLLYFLIPMAALADSPERCADCHTDEIEAWQDSPHAKAAAEVACEDCHGAYVEGHPKDRIMQLGVDSASCQTCHPQTYQQWQDSSHGQANVQCISCHLSHSQEFRLTDEALCTSCHRDQLKDFNHATHAQANLACTDCHVSSIAPTSSESALKANTPPDHSFVVTSEECVSCHEQAAQSAFQPVNRKNSEVGPTLELAAQLKSAEQANQSLKAMSFGGLGLGIGIGGILGIACMLVIGASSRRREP